MPLLATHQLCPGIAAAGAFVVVAGGWLVTGMPPDGVGVVTGLVTGLVIGTAGVTGLVFGTGIGVAGGRGTVAAGVATGIGVVGTGFVAGMVTMVGAELSGGTMLGVVTGFVTWFVVVVVG